MPDPSGEARTAPGTMFPSLYGGGTPGDQPAPEDITDQVLPDLTPRSDLAPGTGSNLSVVPSGSDAPPGTPVPAQGNVQAPSRQEGRRPRTAEERIAQLTRRYRQAEDQNNNLSAQISELLQTTRAQAAEIAAIRAGRVPQPEVSADPTGGAAAQGSIPITLDAVRQVVGETLRSYDSERRATESRIQQMRASHEAAFKEAALDMPELMDTRSRARQIFDELYASSPLIQLPDGPYHIALQVKGLLADEQRQGAAQEVRKVQASAVAPTGGVDLPNSELTAARQEFAKLTQLRKNGNEDFPVYRRWKMLRDFLAANKAL